MLLRSITNETVEDTVEGQVWSRSGGKQVRKYRCTSGIRKGRTMASPASCNKPINISKSASLKRTKAAKPGTAQMTGIKTRRQNTRSLRLPSLNRNTNNRRRGRI